MCGVKLVTDFRSPEILPSIDSTSARETMTSGALGLSDLGQEELDFSDLFLYNPPDDCDKGAHLHNEDKPPLLVVHNLCADIFSSDPPTAIHTPVAHNLHGMGVEFDTLGLTSRPEAIPARSPLIKITPSGDSLSSQPPEPSPSSEALGPYREQRCVSPASSNSSTGWPVEGCSPSASPCVSPGSGGCGIGLSALELCPGIQGIPGIKGNPVSSAHSSPGASPRTSITEETFLMPQHRAATCPLTHQRSRSASPKGKRPYDQYNSPCLGGTPVKQRSRSPSPIPKTQDQHESYYLYHHQVQSEPQSQSLPQPQTQSQTQHQCRVASPCLEEMLSSRSSSLPRVAASKIAATSEESCMYGQTERQDCAYGEVQGWHAEQGRAGAEVKPNTLHIHPNVCPPPYAPCHGLYSGPPVAPLAPLEWPLPSCSGPYELVIQQQPRSHHRAHYETEGSRGAIKTPVGGHPEVQLLGYRGTSSLGLQIFIGTADERNLKPHAFYQVHRITGKTVTTPSLERMFHGTKVLEIPLEPKSHMRALIDCAGILKLRNADIELRNGETDIGRKNTRVCVVFRVHVPQPGGSFVSLQVASQPIECSQRSAQELPSVERQDLDRCSVLGGQQLVLTGQNFTSDSRVIFSEKTQDGQQIWEVESMVDRDKTKPTMLFVEVPPYRDPTIYHPAKVNFYVINGKKKRSQPQHFIYMPLIAIKTEPLDSYTLYGCDPFGISPKSFHDQPDPNSHSRGLSLSPPPHHLANPDHGIMPKYLDGPSLFYSSRVNSSPVLYHAPNQQHGFSGDNLAGGFPAQGHDAGLKPFLYPSLVSHLSGGHCANTAGSVSEFGREGENHQAAAASLSQGNDLFAACLLPRHQGHATSVECLGSSPPLKYTQRQSHPAAKPGSMAALCGQLLSPRSPTAGSLCEKLEVKQENHSQVYLEDVNDIIRRDMKAHSGDGP